jgi:hypothetical protein
VLAVLSAVTQQLRPDEQLSFDAIVAGLTTAEMLHYEHRRVQGLVIECLRQVVRVCKLDNYTHQLMPPTPSPASSPASAATSPQPASDKVHVCTCLCVSVRV